jgi:hypothetical protein
MALNEVSNARAINETYKKIMMDKFPIVSHKLGEFLKDKKHPKTTKHAKSKAIQMAKKTI